MFANYAIEGRHKYNKAGVARCSNKFGGRGSDKNADIAKQEITRSFRQTKQDLDGLSSSERKKRKKQAKEELKKSSPPKKKQKNQTKKNEENKFKNKSWVAKSLKKFESVSVDTLFT